LLTASVLIAIVTELTRFCYAISAAIERYVGLAQTRTVARMFATVTRRIETVRASPRSVTLGRVWLVVIQAGASTIAGVGVGAIVVERVSTGGVHWLKAIWRAWIAGDAGAELRNVTVENDVGAIRTT
jgi:hypothetical protein